MESTFGELIFEDLQSQETARLYVVSLLLFVGDLCLPGSFLMTFPLRDFAFYTVPPVGSSRTVSPVNTPILLLRVATLTSPRDRALPVGLFLILATAVRSMGLFHGPSLVSPLRLCGDIQFSSWHVPRVLRDLYSPRRFLCSGSPRIQM